MKKQEKSIGRGLLREVHRNTSKKKDERLREKKKKSSNEIEGLHYDSVVCDLQRRV